MEQNVPTTDQLSALQREKEAQIIEKLEALDCYDGDKISILLTYKKLALANHVMLGKYFEEGLTDEQRQKCIVDFEEVCKDMGLYFEQFKNTIEGYEETLNYFISSTVEGLEGIKKANYKDNKESLLTGTLLGYPASAVKAYVEGEEKLLPVEAEKTTIPEQIINSGYMVFLQFRLSKEHWEDELETVKKWSDEVKRFDPALYEREVARYKKMLANSKEDPTAHLYGENEMYSNL